MKSDFSSTIDVGNIKENPKQAQEGKLHLIFWEVRGRQIQISEQNECVTRVEMAGQRILYEDHKTVLLSKETKERCKDRRILEQMKF